MWPEGTELARLADIARDCLARREGVRRQHKDHPTQLAYPLAAGTQLHGAVVLELTDHSPAAANASLPTMGTSLRNARVTSLSETPAAMNTR